MQGGIAQTIGLVLAVNAKKRGLAVPAFWPAGSIFKFCKTVDFEGRKGRGFLGGACPRRPRARACEAAWVFGGMGSWNDLGFQGEDQQTYERLSHRLFQLVF